MVVAVVLMTVVTTPGRSLLRCMGIVSLISTPFVALSCTTNHCRMTWCVSVRVLSSRFNQTRCEAHVDDAARPMFTAQSRHCSSAHSNVCRLVSFEIR